MTKRKGSYQAIPHKSLDWSDLGVTVDAISGFGNASWVQNNSQYGTYPRGNYTFSTDSNTYEDAGGTYADDTFRLGSNYKSVEEAKAAYQNGTLTTPVFIVQQGAGRLPLIYRINGFQPPKQEEPVVEEPPVETIQNPPTVTSKPATAKKSKPVTPKGTYVPTEYLQGLAKISGGQTYYTFDGYSDEDIAAAIDQVIWRYKDDNYYIEDPSNPINESVTTEVPETLTTQTSTSSETPTKTTKRSLLGRAKDWLFGHTDDTSDYTTRKTSSNYVMLQGYTYPHRYVHLWSVDPEVAARVRKILTETATPKTTKNDFVWTSVPMLNLPNGELNDSVFHIVYKDKNGYLTDYSTMRPLSQSIPYHVNNQDVLYETRTRDDTNIYHPSNWGLKSTYGMTPDNKRLYLRDNAAEIRRFEANRLKGILYDVDAEYPYLQSTTPQLGEVVTVEEALANPERYSLQVKSDGGTLNYIKFFNNALSNKF